MALATRIGGEIVVVDSMQVYRGLDIGTAKPDATQQQRVRHHLLDVVGMTESFDAARFVRLATDALADIRARGRVPLLCGGTGLYFKALFEGLGDTPPADAALRAKLEAMPLADLLAALGQRDPETLARIDRHNRRRVVRALEVVRLTGKSLAAQRAPWRTRTDSLAGTRRGWFFGLARQAEDLRARVEVRTEAMFARGLVAEVEALRAAGLERNRTAMQALGYRQCVEHLRGERSLPETIALVKHRTWQYARRQMTWFRHQLPVQWVPVAAGEAPAVTAERILALGRAVRETTPP